MEELQHILLARHIALLTEALMVITAEHLQPLLKQVLAEVVSILLVTMAELQHMLHVLHIVVLTVLLNLLLNVDNLQPPLRVTPVEVVPI